MPDSAAQAWTWKRVARRVRVPLGFCFAALYLWLARPTPLMLAAGAAVAAAGLALRAAASGHVRKDRELTTTGPYRFVRHPLYAGSIVIAAGFALAARSLWVVAAMALLFAAIYWPTMMSEEEYLRAHFPGYDDYARQVPRLLPGLHRAPGGAGAFSRELYLRHREYNALAGALALLAALVAKLLWLHNR